MHTPSRLALAVSFLGLLGACTVKTEVADAGTAGAADAGSSEDSGGDTNITVDGMNGCKTAGYLDETKGTANDRMIMIAGGKFDYPCMTIKTGQSVMLMWNFATYPLAPGLAPDHASDPAGTDPTTDPSSVGDDAGSSDDGGKGELDAAPAPGLDAAAPVFDDGTSTRLACVATLGSGLSPTHGRLDGTLVSIVPIKAGSCPSDPDHLHLQVRMSGAVYDIAVNLDGLEGEIDAKLPGIPFSEGWHPMDLEYVKDLGLHSTALSLSSPAAIRQRVELALTNANHISVFGFSYPGSDGAHLIHRVSASHDGALVINPLAAKAHVIAFRFATDTF